MPSTTTIRPPDRPPRPRRRCQRACIRRRSSAAGTDQNQAPKARHESFRCYPSSMNLVSRTLEIDADTDARLREIATERGKDVASVLAEAVALLDSVVDLSGPDLAEDRRRYDEFKRT